MPILVSAHRLSKNYSSRALFQSITFSIESGDRIGLVGPNGAGKSTLLKILSGNLAPDSGDLSFQKGLKLGFLEQVPTFKKNTTIMQALLEKATDPDEWEAQSMAYELMSRLSLNQGVYGPDTLVDALSGGWKKRVALGRELLKKPDLLLLDEPTNHLDLDSILWLEEWIDRADMACVIISHDRAFLQKTAKKIFELDRRNVGGLLVVDGDFATFLETKEAVMESQANEEARLRNTVRRETEWLRQGAKARTTKQQARIQRAEKLTESLGDLASRNRQANLELQFQASEKRSKKLVVAEGIQKSFQGNEVIPALDIRLHAGDRIALVGPNGCGKSTLIRLLIGSEKTDAGTLFIADGLRHAYFEQNRDSLDMESTALQVICPDGEFVTFQGNRMHVRGYLGRFAFSPFQMETKVRLLSGGEQCRLLLAKLMLTEADVLILDEPTNDLDLATLAALEEVLQEFPGAVILVTHDRFFMDQIADRFLCFGYDEQGKKQIFSLVGMEQWNEWRQTQAAWEQKRLRQQKNGPAAAAPVEKKSAKKLSFKEQRELDSMEVNIKTAEKELGELMVASQDPGNATNAKLLLETTQKMAALQARIDHLYARWSELE